MREKDRVERWREEIELCGVDLACCKRWFKYQADRWELRRLVKNIHDTPGHTCYLEKQIQTWKKLESRADDAIEETKEQCENVVL